MKNNQSYITDLQQHKVYIEDLKMEMVPYSVAVEAIKQIAELETKEYIDQLEHTMNELSKTINGIQNS